MARRGGEGGGGANPMNVLIAAFIGLLVIIAILALGPVLGEKLQTSTPTGVTSVWNNSVNTQMPNVSKIWSDNVNLGILVLLVFFISLAIYFIRMVG
jgi:hypothetical protein